MDALIKTFPFHFPRFVALSLTSQNGNVLHSDDGGCRRLGGGGGGGQCGNKGTQINSISPCALLPLSLSLLSWL